MESVVRLAAAAGAAALCAVGGKAHARGVGAVLGPAADSLYRMGAALSALYGPVSLQRCRSRSGTEQIVLLKEPEPPGPGEGR